jgi:hypothetical protein
MDAVLNSVIKFTIEISQARVWVHEEMLSRIRVEFEVAL